ncbi:O-fucosyltransferase 39 [Bienertia sinuspersici]
MAAHPACDFGG